jgi:hypothetical protein
MTVQSAAGYEGTEPFLDIGGPPRAGRPQAAPVLQDSEALIPSAEHLGMGGRPAADPTLPAASAGPHATLLPAGGPRHP